MARLGKYSAAVINIRIPEPFSRDYSLLLQDISKLKVGYKVRGTTFIALTFFNYEENRGKFSRYTDIDLDGEWFNTDTFDAAEEDETAKIELPENLKPNLTEFTFKLFPERHLLTFLTKVPGKTRLTPSFIEKYLKLVCSHETITSKYGDVETTIVKDLDNVSRIVSSETLRHLKIVVRKPNTDDLSGKLRKVIEKRLNKNSANRITEEFFADKGDVLTPTDRTKALAGIGATTGEVYADEIVDGVTIPISTVNTVEENTKTFDTDMGEFRPLSALSDELVQKVEAIRDADGLELDLQTIDEEGPLLLEEDDDR